MSYRHKLLGRIALLTVFLGWLALIGPAGAQEEASVLVEKQSPAATEGPVLPPPMPPSAEQEAPRQPAPPAERRFLRPAEPERSQSAPRPAPRVEEQIPHPGAGEIEVRRARHITYDTDRGARRMYVKSGVVEIVMLTQNPADGCYYEIPLCVPACCAGEEPRMDCGRGIFGRGVVEYCWPCGFEVEVKFRLRGDIKVEYDA